MPVLNEALEAAIIRDPDDLSSYAVYGDWLAEQGDPRGELIATQLAADATGDPELRRAALRVFSKHREYFVGSLGSMIAADSFTWRAGFIQRAVLSHDRLLIEDGARVASSLAQVVEVLLAHPSARFLTDLVIRTNDRDMWNRIVGSQKDVVDRIAAARPVLLRRLQLGEFGYGHSHVGSLDHAWPALATLRELVLEGDFQLGRLELPLLEKINLAPMPLRRRGGRELVEAQWPQLRTLRIHLEHAPDHLAREIVTLLHRDDMPHVVDLALTAYKHAEQVLDELSRAPLLARLRTLDLTAGRISDRGLRPVLANPEAFQHLELIELGGTAITAKTFARLQKLLPNVSGDWP